MTLADRCGQVRDEFETIPDEFSAISARIVNAF
jgi:hypothetical protein